MRSGRRWVVAMVTCWLGTAAYAQPSDAPAPTPGHASDTAPDPVHPLFVGLTPPAWLSGRSRMLVISPPVIDATATSAWVAALQAAFARGLPVGVVDVALEGEVSGSALVTRLGRAGHDVGVTLLLRRDQQRVVLTARYLDALIPAPVEHISQTSVPLDAFLTRVVGGVPAVRADRITARSMRFNVGGILGAFAADLDGDQRDELIVARGPHVSVYTLESTGGARLRIVRRARSQWPIMRPAVPMGRRVAAWFSAHRGRVVLSRSDREGAFALALAEGDLHFEPMTSPCVGGQLFPDGCARWVPGRDYFDGELVGEGAPVTRDASAARDEDVEPSDDYSSHAPRFYSRSVHDVRQPDGETLRVDVVATPRGSLVARVAENRATTGNQGASLAAADVDADGALDVLTSDYVREGQADRLRWHRVSAEGRMALLWESPPLSGSVLHSVAGDFFGTGRPVFVSFETSARSGSRVWVVD